MSFLTTVGHFSKERILPEEFLLTGITGTTISDLPEFDLGTGQLSIWRNGVEMFSTDVGLEIQRYTEISDTVIELDVAATADEVFAATVDPNVDRFSEWDLETTTTLTVPLYPLGTDRLLLYRNGILMTTDASVGITTQHYTEATGTTVTLAVTAVATDAWRAEVLDTAPVYREELDGQTGLTIATTNPVFALDEDLTIFRNGVLMDESISAGLAVNRYQVTGENQITLEVAAAADDRFTFFKRA